MAVMLPEGNYTTDITNISDTSQTTIYTCNLVWAFVIEMLFSDDGGAARTIQLVVTRGGTDYTLGFNLTIPANELLRVEGPLALANGDIIKATTSAGGVDAYVTKVEGGR